MFKGQPLAMGDRGKGHRTAHPTGTKALTNAQVESDLNRPLAGGVQSIVVTAVLMWFIAAGIIGLIVYLSAIERMRDFAVFKATGVRRHASSWAASCSRPCSSRSSRRCSPSACRSWSGWACRSRRNSASRASLQLLVISLVVGVLASLAGVRRALTTDPAVAFGGK